MPEEIVVIEEIEKKLIECRYATDFYTILRDALIEGNFVLFNSETNKYRIVKAGQPIFEVLPDLLQKKE